MNLNKYLTAIKAANAFRIATYVIVGILSIKDMWKLFKAVRN